VTNSDDVGIGAISVSGPKNRMREERFTEDLPEQVTGTANVIELNLKFD
jgi:DNA-binding IclR family transcriptional regulator